MAEVAILQRRQMRFETRTTPHQCRFRGSRDCTFIDDTVPLLVIPHTFASLTELRRKHCKRQSWNRLKWLCMTSRWTITLAELRLKWFVHKSRATKKPRMIPSLANKPNRMLMCRLGSISHAQTTFSRWERLLSWLSPVAAQMDFSLVIDLFHVGLRKLT